MAMVSSVRGRWIGTAAVAALLVGVLVAAPAGATDPGENGLIYAFTIDGEPVSIAPDGTVTTLETFIGPFEMADVDASPDGSQLLVPVPDAVHLLPADGSGEPQVVAQLPEDGDTPESIQWGPDGQSFAFLRFGDLVLGGVDGRPLQTVELDRSPDDLFWTAQDRLLVVAADAEDDFYEALYEVDRSTGATTRLVPAGDEVSISPDGTRLVATCAFLDERKEDVEALCIRDIASGDTTLLDPFPQEEESQPRWSPDGQRIAFLEDFTSEQAFTVAIDGSDLRPLTDRTVEVLGPWSVQPSGPPPGPPPSQDPLLPGGFDGDPATTERADFADPIAYAIAVSRARFADGAAAHAVLSRDDAFPDSLVGAALTGEGPLLFTSPTVLPAMTAAELSRAVGDGGRVYVLGGTSAVSAEIEAQLAATFEVVRLAGPSRVETSVAVAREAMRLGPATSGGGYGGGPVVAIARAGGPAENPTAGWADSVSVGAWTAAGRMATVVTDSAAVHPAVAAFLAEVDPAMTVLLGGEVALSATVEQAVPAPRRIAGASRAGTAQAIATELVWDDPTGRRDLVVINGFRPDGWLFGLPAAGLAADAGAAIGMVGDTVPPETAEMACPAGDVDVLLAGSAGIVSADVAAALEAC